MIVQNFSKWTTTQEISKMLMEIQGTETQKRVNILGQEYIFWVLGGQWLCTAIPRFVRTSNSALSISAQKQILTTPRFVRIINSISAHVSQLRCCNFDVV